MAEIESREKKDDQKIRECLQEAYGYSDEQLLAELEEVEKNVSESAFAGAEDRIFRRLMERQAAGEKKTELEKLADRAGTESPEEDSDEEDILKEVPDPTPKTTVVPEKERPVRFGKKKVILAAALVALFVGMLGVTAIGGKNYFFKGREKEKGIVFNSDESFIRVENIAEAYDEAEKHLGMEIMELGYIPENMVFKELYLDQDIARFEFEYGDKIIHFVQQKSQNEVSVSLEFDRHISENSIFNQWLQSNVYINSNTLDNGEEEYSLFVTVKEAVYWLVGEVPKEEIEKIAKNLNLY